MEQPTTNYYRSDEEAIRQLVDEAFKAGKLMIQTHLKDDIMRFIHLAKQLDALGYQMIWVKHRGVVGATRKLRGDNLTYSQMTKEVQDRANKGTDGTGNIASPTS